MKTISVVIPMYNESKRIDLTLEKAKAHLAINPGDEVIFVDDGSTDDTREKVALAMIGGMKLLCLSHSGKWGAVRNGILAATRQCCAVLDVDLSVGFDFVNEAKDVDSEGMIIGCRYGFMKSEVPLKRKIFSRAFNLLVRALIIDVKDSQVPAKFFELTNEIRYVAENMKENGFVGDVEFIAMAARGGVSILELDVKYVYERETKIGNIIKTAKDMFLGVLRIRKRIGRKVVV